VKRTVSIPVSGVGHIDPGVAELILSKGLVDLVCFGRPLLADPYLPRKLMEGRVDEIRPCLRCNICLHHILLAKPLRCRINPYLGNETTLPVKPAVNRKKVMVVGAGPSGLEAARIAAERGHSVEIYDRSRELGGLLPLAVFIKGTETDNLQRAIDYYRKQMKRLDVSVHLRQDVDAPLVQRVAPDVLVLAIGGKPIEPTLQIDAGSHVVTTDELRGRAAPYVTRLGAKITSWLSKVHIPVGKRVLIVGGDLTGLETAEWLVKHGRVVTVVEESDVLGAGMPIPWLSRLLPWLTNRGVTIYTRTAARRAIPAGLETTTHDGQHRTLKADTILLVSRYEENSTLHKSLEGVVPEVFRVGDARGGPPGYVLEAIRSGAEVGIRI
jgi:2,4-dienoyl-CoA reductase (NADPH2)